MLLKKLFKNKSAKELGASLVEYGLLVALIAVIAIAAIRVLGTNVSTKFSQVASGVNS
jgi:pilus assembly protein Flp/PilA